MEIKIVEFFQNISNSFLDVFWGIITKMGEETFFLIAFAGIYLCYSKLFAIKYTFYYLVSVGVNSIVKSVFDRPRPYMVSDTIDNILPASGSSFPSGHTQGYFVQWSTATIELNKKSKRNGFRVALPMIMLVGGVLLMISRMYLGQHFLSDVLVGMMFGIILPFVFDFIIKLIPINFRKKLTAERLFFVIGMLAVIVTAVFVIVQFSIGFYLTRIYKFLGVLSSMSIGYFIDYKYIGYEPNQGWLWGFVKFLITAIVLFGGYFILALLVPLTGYYAFLIYFVLGLFATTVLPFVFSLLNVKEINK